ncbi:MAG: hypothetical protein KDI83_09370 [Gammaproteobacteria bacterium]|nr:hypothetical protein [Gammaproteobacteria bacterium]
MKEWKWQIYSLVVSIVTMAFVYVIVTAPTNYKLTAAAGLAVLLLLLFSNPINRYIKLAIILVSSWLGIVSGTSAKLSLLLFDHGKLNVDFNQIPIYVHVVVLILTLALIVADYRSRERDKNGKQRPWTKNRIEVLKHLLRFYAFIAVLICLLLFTLIVIHKPDPPIETATVKIERKADYSDIHCSVVS